MFRNVPDFIEMNTHLHHLSSSFNTHLPYLSISSIGTRIEGSWRTQGESDVGVSSAACDRSGVVGAGTWKKKGRKNERKWAGKWSINGPFLVIYIDLQ